jgi:hypothetical protein
MKILFLIGATSRIRNFHESLTQLADDGHVIHLTGRLRKGQFELPKSVTHERITGGVNPTQRTDDWRDYVDLLRGARDYVRYFDPRYAKATRLVRRAYEIAPTDFVLFCERNQWVKRHWQRVSQVLALCEDLIPPDPGFVAFLKEQRPDLVLVTPLVTFESYQTDYVKAAHALGVPIVFLPFSWDNLTNKGLMRIQPDRVLAWNETQRSEAIELHGCPPERLEVTGAARFDDFFERTPSMSREQFLTDYGLDPTRPMVLYLGSSQLTGPNEMELIRRWAESMRTAEDPAVRGCNLLIRPHPALRNSWTSVDLSEFGPVAISLNASRNADQELFDSIYHSHATVGLNTSAMLEAAIVGRPVHTLLIPGFDEGQVGTMHFYYLVEAHGGVATAARDFAEHHQQLAGVLQGEPISTPRSRHFAEQFLRPHGIDRPVAPILTAAIERAGEGEHRIVTHQPQAAPFWHAPLRSGLLWWLKRRSARTRATGDTSAIATTLSLRPVRTALEEIQQGTAPVFVGPWLDSVGNELLYWIPFVRWAAATYGIPPERLIAVSRSGVGEWYGAIAHRYLDARTLFSPPELEHWSHRSVPQSEQDYKQAVLAPFDQDVLDRAARAFDLSEYQVLHPFLLFRVLGRMHKDRTLNQMADVLRHARPDAQKDKDADALPRSFVAVSVGLTPALPDSDENRQFLSDLVAGAAADQDVVVVDGPVPGGVTLPASPRVHVIDGAAAGRDALRAQMRAIAKARAFVGGHGDLSILAAACGTPVVAYHSERLPADHEERLQSAAASAGWGAVTVERARRFKSLRLPAASKA